MYVRLKLYTHAHTHTRIHTHSTYISSLLLTKSWEDSKIWIECWAYAQFSQIHTVIHTPFQQFICTAIHFTCHHGPSMGSNSSLIALSISGSPFFSLCFQPLCVTSDRENVLESYYLLDGITDKCWIPEPRELHATLIITKPFLLFEGGQVIKAAAASNATPASTSHSDRIWVSISQREVERLNPNLPLQRGPRTSFFRKELK